MVEFMAQILRYGIKSWNEQVGCIILVMILQLNKMTSSSNANLVKTPVVKIY